MVRNERHRLVYRHIGREYLLSFVVAFLFFFFIFFINQILLLAQKILLKHVDYGAVFKLILLSIPQFLLFTFPFSSLSAASMVIGDLSGGNEILAMRSCGISLQRVFIPIVALSLVFSYATFWTADYALPWSTHQYRELYTSLMQDLPTLELKSNSANTIGSHILVNKEVDGSTVKDITLFDLAGKNERTVITSAHGEVSLVDLDNLVYRLDLDNPRILTSNPKDITSWSLAEARSAQFYLNFSGQVASLATALPSQLSLTELRQQIALHKENYQEELLAHQSEIAKQQKRVLEMQETGQITYLAEAEQELKDLKQYKIINFYYQYYRAELHKKYALSLACAMLVFLTFPLSFFRVKHGRLMGFGLSMVVAVLYWYLLFFAQMKIFSVSFNPAYLMWAPNIILFTVGIALLSFTRRL